MTGETVRRRCLGIGAGTVATAAVFALLMALGLGVGWLILRGETRADRALAVLLWAGPSAIVACTAGGWIAVRLGGWRRTGAGAATGILVVAIALVALGSGVKSAIGANLNIQSVRDVLDGDDIAEQDLGALPPAFATAVATGAPAVDVSETARQRTRQTLGYGAAVAALNLLAAAVGGAAGTARRLVVTEVGEERHRERAPR